MKKTIITLLALCGVAAADTTVVTFGTQESTSNPSYVTDAWAAIGTASPNMSFTLSNKDVLTLTGDVSGRTFYSGSNDGTVEKTWANTAAITDMNNVLGTSFTAADFSTGSSLYYTATGDGGSKSTLTLDINSGNVGDTIILYVTAAARGTHTHGFSVTGLDNVTLSYAGLNGNGFGTSGVDGNSIVYDGSNSTLKGNWSPNSESVMIFKVEGTLTDANIVMSQATTAKNGWQTLSYKVVPEPTTATLSLLALAGLAARRRRATR